MTRSLILLALATTAIAQTPTPKTKTANDYVAQLVAKLTPTRKITYKKVGDRELSLHVFQPDALAGF
jgi:acetyl esterase